MDLKTQFEEFLLSEYVFPLIMGIMGLLAIWAYFKFKDFFYWVRKKLYPNVECWECWGSTKQIERFHTACYDCHERYGELNYSINCEACKGTGILEVVREKECDLCGRILGS